MGLAALIHDSDRLFVSTGAAEPAALIDELVDEVAPIRRDLSAFQILTGSRGRLINIARYGHRVITTVPGRLRDGDASTLSVLDLSMRQCARAMEEGKIPIDGALVSVTRAGDSLYPVPSTDLAMVALERARFRAAEVMAWRTTPSAPKIHVHDVDYVIDGAQKPAEFISPDSDEAARRIGAFIAELVPDGATIELGIGRGLASVADSLSHTRLALSVHSGLISDWAQQLVDAGVANAARPCGRRRPIVAAVAMGSTPFNEWLAGSDAVTFADSRHAHDPAHLMSLHPFVAINSAAAVDLEGRVGLPPGYRRTVSSGGLADFAIAGAYSGKSIIALHSRDRDGRSAVVPHLEAVHLTANLVTHIVTENGVAELTGKSAEERRRALLEVADPASAEPLMPTSNSGYRHVDG